ncbi:MAG: thioredoxin domain-containing protein, partial [Syntrophaceae bacterium]|nr:thioredoxin domain-containing protein [Syntrophaceae bacterium]
MNHNDSLVENRSSDRKSNRLINEKSPYLLQHAYNPVDWFPWGEEAFSKAKQEDRPIFLSIGYSTCHWCHVMEKESFEDTQVADLMNDTFVSIKVDREERPDIDHIYMTVCQMMTGGGGWPLNIIMTPDKKPFFAGTYFPKESHYGRIGMIDLAPRIKKLWSDNRDEVVEAARKVTYALNQIPDDAPGAGLSINALREAHAQLAQRFDSARGGFSQAPKFPTPHNLLFLMRYANRTSEKSVMAMVEKTLENMRRGGIYDHIGFGFHRYSTDNEWLAPHFEKMLYDQAMIALAYTEAYQITRNYQYKKTVEEIFEYVLRDMTSNDGAFFSAEDADSEGVEGKFYVWSLDEMLQILSAGEARVACKIFGIRAEGNFKEESTG